MESRIALRGWPYSRRIVRFSQELSVTIALRTLTYGRRWACSLSVRSARKPSLGQMLTVVIEQGETSIWKILSAGAPTTTLAAVFIVPLCVTTTTLWPGNSAAI